MESRTVGVDTAAPLAVRHPLPVDHVLSADGRARWSQPRVSLRVMAMPMPLPILPTTLVGSWPQPSWLIDRDRLDAHLPVRVSARDLWRGGGGDPAGGPPPARALARPRQGRGGPRPLTPSGGPRAGDPHP